MMELPPTEMFKTTIKRSSTFIHKTKRTRSTYRGEEFGHELDGIGGQHGVLHDITDTTYGEKNKVKLIVENIYVRADEIAKVRENV